MKSASLRVIVGIIMFLFGLHCPAQSPQRHSSDCWIERLSNYGVTFTGNNPSLTEIHDKIRSLSLTYNVPIEIIGAVAYQESTLYQYGSDSFVVHNHVECSYCNDHGVINPFGTVPPPGLGMMQLTGPTAAGTGNVPRLITDWQFNLEEGVKHLANLYQEGGLGTEPTWMLPLMNEHTSVLENWFYALRRFNGYKKQVDDPAH